VPGLASYILRRLMIAPIILLAVSFVTFSLGRYAPGDYVENAAGTSTDRQTIERIREERGLNDPVYQQYGRWLGNFVQGDFGYSTRPRGTKVEDAIMPRIWVTVQYNIVVLILTFGIGIPVGTWAATRRGTWLDPFSIGVFLFFASVPVVVAIPLMQWLFALQLGLFPTTGWETRSILGIETGLLSNRIILPIVILTLPGVAGLARYVRAQVIEVLDQDFVRTARAKGLAESVVVGRHVVRNAMLPIATILGFELAGLMAGSIFVETLFGIPGIGRYAFESIESSDYDAIMAIVLLGSAAFIFANLMVDIAYGFIDPRIRLSGGARS
jgi:ABC-type dipeptide/oligopeptide/nickel transport system permease component